MATKTKDQLIAENTELRNQIIELTAQLNQAVSENNALTSQLNLMIPEESPAYKALEHKIERLQSELAVMTDLKNSAQKQAAEYKALYQEQAAKFERFTEHLPAVPPEKTGKAGRPATIPAATVEQARQLRADGYSIRQIAKTLKISVGSVARLTDQ